MGCPLTDKKASVLPKQPLQFRTLHITKNFVFAKVTDSLLISKYFYLFSTLFPINGLYVRETRLPSIEHDERGPVERVVEIRAVHEVVSGEVQGLMLGFSGNEVREKRIMNSEVAVSLTLQRVMRMVWTPAFLNAVWSPMMPSCDTVPEAVLQAASTTMEQWLISSCAISAPLSRPSFRGAPNGLPCGETAMKGPSSRRLRAAPEKSRPDPVHWAWCVINW